ncbi:MAG: hypothetical protein JNJ54_34970 [Myxococcaceae bacterium]|nr:hypothetical protein [Myxococcaceae bacterium]
MASAWYPSGKQGVMNGGIDLDTSDIRVLPVQSGYTYSAAHDNLDDISAPNRAGSAVALGSKSIITPGSPANARALDAADTALGTIASAGNALVLYLHTGVESTSTLLAYIDGISWTAGQSVTVQWDANGIIYLN